MIAIGYHFVFIICLSELTLSVNDDQFNEESNFLNYIFNLHNEVRIKHGVQLLIRDEESDDKASRILDSRFNDTHEPLEGYGINSQSMMYNDDTVLTEEEADELFAEWYNTEDNYNYCFEPSNDNAVEFTQIVWNNTEKIGLALKWAIDYYVVLVVYYPSGNIQGQFKTNVLQPPIIAQANNSIYNFFIYERDARNYLDYIHYLHNQARTNHGVSLLIRDVRFIDELNITFSEVCISENPKNAQISLSMSLLTHSGKRVFAVNLTNNYIYMQMDEIATQILNNMALDMNRRSNWFGMNYQNKTYDNNTRLDAAEAEAVFSEWYNNDAAEFTRIVWGQTTNIGISMKREVGYYRILALYHPHMGNIQRMS